MKTDSLYRIYRECGCRVATDSRKIAGGELFFALKGENFDGNEYAFKALEAGAAYAVVDRCSSIVSGRSGEESRELSDRLIPVDDTLKTMQELARWHRSVTSVDGRPLPVIALTGTNGKTTTKELIREVLSVKYRVTATEGNLNNSIGVPLTLLRIDGSTQIAVVEMGASHPGDIRELVSIALPTYGLITNVGKAHLLGFGSFEGVMEAKGELYDYLQRTADPAFLNMDNQYLRKMASDRPDLRTIPYGLMSEGAEVLPASAGHPYLRIRLSDGQEIDTHLTGAYNADNVMSALAVGREFGVGETEAVKAISAYIPSNNRSQIVKTEANVLIVDAYNANPTSMAAALDNLDSVEMHGKAVMLGNMLELGKDSVSEHVNIVRRLSVMKGLDCKVLVGDEFRKALEDLESAGDSSGKGCIWFQTSSQAAAYLKEHPVNGCCVLVKGSRGSRMEEVIPEL